MDCLQCIRVWFVLYIRMAKIGKEEKILEEREDDVTKIDSVVIDLYCT